MEVLLQCKTHNENFTHLQTSRYDLKQYVEKELYEGRSWKLNPGQTGFRSGMGCEVNLRGEKSVGFAGVVGDF